MRRQAIIAALLIVGVGVVLGATVFRADIAQATGLAQSVTVANTTTNPVPVREQNLDGSGNIKVHEQGNVQVTDAGSPGRAAVFYQGVVFDIPAGHRVIITYVSAEANQFVGAVALPCTLKRTGGGVTENLAFMRLEPTGNGIHYVGSEQVFIPVNAGQELLLECGLVQNLNVGFGGYMIPTT